MDGVQPRKRFTLPVDPGARRRSAVLILAGVAATIAIWWWTPLAAVVPACPVREHAGVYCPGCGSLRATHRVLTGRLDEAWRYNALLVAVGLPLAAWFWAEQICILVTGRRFRPLLRNSRIAWAALVLLVCFAVVRNLPGEPFSRLRPPELAEPG